MNYRKMLTARTPHWFDFITPEDGSDTTEIRIDGVVGGSFWDEGTSARDFIAALNSVATPNITVRINSPGGMVFEGFAIYNALKSSGRHIRVIVDGIAASIAAVIAMAGDEIVMPEASYLMIHYPWTVLSGNAEQLIAEAETLETLGKTIEKVFTDRSGQPLEKIQALMKGKEGADGTFISSDEALDLGLCTEVEPNKTAAAACAGLDVYSLIPPQLRTRDSAGQPPKEDNPDSYASVFSEFINHNHKEVAYK